MKRARLLPLLVVLLLACTAPENRQVAAPADDPRDPQRRPNVIVVVVDDLRYDELGVAGHPYLQTPNIDRLASEGAYFTRAFHTVPLCSPNRASILTGQYPSRHGIIDNVARNRASHMLETFPQALHEYGYETAFLGKWHMGNDPTPRPGFDYWVSIPGQGRTKDPELYEDGRIHTVPGYITDVLTDRAVSFIEKERSAPFFLYIGHKAIHPDVKQLDDGSVDRSSQRGYNPAPRDRGRYDDRVFPRRGNVGPSAEDLAGKPALARALAAKSSAEMVELFGEEILDPGTSEETIRRRAEMVLAVDEGLGRMMDALERRGILDDTFILFTSDNGFFYGEHGLSLERRLPYEESIRNPLLVRYPPAARPGSRIDGLVATIDIAPTVLDIAGVPLGGHVQGRSFAPLLRGDDPGGRESVFVEFYTYENPFPWLTDMDYRAVRTERYKYIHWVHHPGEGELYDLARDSLEMHNLIADPAMADVLADLRGRMAAGVVEAVGIPR